MGRKKKTYCTQNVSVPRMIAGQPFGSESQPCGRCLPCLIHTPYQPEYPAPIRGPRRATLTEIAAGSTCANCLRAAEIRPHGGPATAVRCLLHDETFFPEQVARRTCNDFTLPPVLSLAHSEVA